ncbi:MAG: hypothetical protein RI539_00295 [Spiribacter sp.]|nr:hypothetical protein [Spiribacter sp.]MDR9488764.1 hypothetical protein [Spiribacter sp.]
MANASSITKRYWLGGAKDSTQTRFFVNALDRLGWLEGDATHWDSAWFTEMPPARVFAALTPSQSVNHIPGNNQITVKSALPQTLYAAEKRWQNLTQKTYPSDRASYIPASFNLPEDDAAFQRYASENPTAVWIVKPANGARGEGIYLLDAANQVPRTPGWVVQHYIDQPHTVEGYKYVLRLYVLVTSIEPLRIDRFYEGSVKLASAPYDPNERQNPYAFLTNPDVNARNPQAPVIFQPLASYCEWLRDQGHDADALFQEIDDLIVRTVMAACEGMRKRCRAEHGVAGQTYELFGLDCLVDASLRPWLLECNLSPSLEICAQASTGGREERAMKQALIEGLIKQVGLDSTASRQDSGYRNLFPGKDPMRYLPRFVAPSAIDQAAANDVLGTHWSPRFVPWQVEERYHGSTLTLYHPPTEQTFAPNPTASWIWLQAVRGVDVDTLISELQQSVASQPGVTHEQISDAVWAALGEWSRAGLLRQCDD